MLTLHRAASFASRAGQLSSNVRLRKCSSTSTDYRATLLALRFALARASLSNSARRPGHVPLRFAAAFLQALPNTWHLQNGLPTALNSLWPPSLRSPGPIALLLHSRRGRRRQCQWAHQSIRHRCTGSSASPQHFRSLPFASRGNPVRPNHSLKLTPHGLQNWPRSAYAHAAPRGQFRKPRGSA